MWALMEENSEESKVNGVELAIPLNGDRTLERQRPPTRVLEHVSQT